MPVASLDRSVRYFRVTVLPFQFSASASTTEHLLNFVFERNGGPLKISFDAAVNLPHIFAAVPLNLNAQISIASARLGLLLSTDGLISSIS